MRVEFLNIEKGMPSAQDAMFDLKKSIVLLKNRGCKCVVIIHGYGSTGKGGILCKRARQYLKAQENNKTIKTVIFGEDFEMFNIKAIELKNKYIELNSVYNRHNNVITIVEL
ncbi:MAG: Smr/MutS family protein [Clostridia bacterium]|nr:Smr/MutS family protein [Clostridia bacterium]